MLAETPVPQCSPCYSAVSAALTNPLPDYSNYSPLCDPQFSGNLLLISLRDHLVMFGIVNLVWCVYTGVYICHVVNLVWCVYTGVYICHVVNLVWCVYTGVYICVVCLYWCIYLSCS